MPGKHITTTRPSLIHLRLSDIEFDSTTSICELHASLRHVTQTIPTISQEALKILELSQPLIVIRIESSETRRYHLVGGFRTFQLLSEQAPRDRRTWSILLPNIEDQALARLEAFDAVVSKLIQRPDGRDLALIATALQDDEKLRHEVSSLIPVATDSDLAAAVGMSRTTLYRQTEAIRKTSAKFTAPREPEAKVDLEFEADKEV